MFIELFKEEIRESPKDVALSIAREKHSYQYRKFSKEMYFNHPSRVAKTIAKYTNDENIIAAAALHDTLEDTNTSLKELDAVFGEKITSLVKELTTIKHELEKVGKANYLLNKMNKMSSGALLIKLCDRLDNVSDFKVASQKFIDKYIKETHFILGNLTNKLTKDHKSLIKEILKQLKPWE